MRFRTLVRSAAPILLLLAAAAVLQAWSRPEQMRPHEELGRFPREFLGWNSTEVEIRDDVREVLGDGEFMQRVYRRAGEPPVDLFIAYFASQRSGSTLHSPKNCLPGAGWTPVESSRVQFHLADGRAVNANRYIIARGQERQLVFYWYQAHGRTLASEYDAKFYLVADAMRLNRTDGSLIRLVTPIVPNESVQAAEQRTSEFAGHIVPRLDAHIPQ